MVATYPKRGSHFAHKVVRMMIKTCAAQEIGQAAVLLVATVAHTEDAKHYSSPVTFYNEQLMAVLAIKKWESLDRARKSAVDAGWLHYEARGKRLPGLYWALIPSHAQRVSDAAIDETLSPLDGDNNEQSLYPPNGYREGDKGGYREGYNEGYPPVLLRNTPVPSPVPDPSESAPADAAGCPSDLKAWIDWWNRLRAESLVPCATGCNPPSDAILKGWSRVRRSAALRELLSDRDAIETAIRESPFCREGWFRLEKLFGGKNRDGEFILRKLLDRGYVTGERHGKPIPIGGGQKHDPGSSGAGVVKW